MPKVLCIIALAISCLLLLVFLLDLAIGVPFGKASLIMDIGLIASSAIIAFLSFATLKEQR